tara:strand:+ start:3620 stop:4576 length:957 start_codon:yes stop_codon:yes gene_type:complete
MKNKIDDNYDPIKSLQLFGLNNYFDEFIRRYENNNFPKVLLLTGDKGIGKFTFVFHLINYFLSKNNKSLYNLKEKIINKDSDIYKQIVSNVSENYVYIQNENTSKATIDQIREIKKKINNSTLNNMPRFIIFDDVELLNLNSANSLLKVIEEPTDTNFFILINNKRSKLIETIKSRSIEFRFFLNILTKNEIFSKLSELNILNVNFSHNFLKFTTPGLLLKFSKIISDNNFNENTGFYEIVSISLEKYKKTKNELFLNFINFFLEIKFEKIILNKDNNLLNSVLEKKNIMKLLYNYKKFNLTNNSVLSFIKDTNNYHA